MSVGYLKVISAQTCRPAWLSQKTSFKGSQGRVTSSVLPFVSSAAVTCTLPSDIQPLVPPTRSLARPVRNRFLPSGTVGFVVGGRRAWYTCLAGSSAAAWGSSRGRGWVRGGVQVNVQGG